MSPKFESFVKQNETAINDLAEIFQDFKIDYSKIGVDAAKMRIINWLENFDRICYESFNLPLVLLQNIEFLTTDNITNDLITLSKEFIKQENTYIAPLGETKESSFRITASLNSHQNFFITLPLLLEKVNDPINSTIILFDDFLNSGGQLINIFYALLNKTLPIGEIDDEIDGRTILEEKLRQKLLSSKIHIFYYKAFDEGIDKIENRLNEELGLRIKIHRYIPANENGGAFGTIKEQENILAGAAGTIKTPCPFLNRKFSDLKLFYISLKIIGEALLKKNEPIWDNQKIKSRVLGYGNKCRLISTDCNVPTITITALWQEAEIFYNGEIVKWTRLFPRTKKVLSPIVKLEKSTKENDNTKELNEDLFLPAPNDQIKINSSFFIQRDPQKLIINKLKMDGALIRVIGSKKMGKTNFLHHIVYHCNNDLSFKFLFFNLNLLNKETIKDYNNLILNLLFRLSFVLEQEDPNKIIELWNQYDYTDINTRFTHIVGEYLLDKAKSIVIIVDDIDLMFSDLSIAEPFYCLLREIHQLGSAREREKWGKVKIVISYAIAKYNTLIDPNYSPFNVGDTFELNPFTESQVNALANAHKISLTNTELNEIKIYLGFHPYLLRLLFYNYLEIKDSNNISKILYKVEIYQHFLKILKEISQDIITNYNLSEKAGIDQCNKEDNERRLSTGIYLSEDNEIKYACKLYEEYFTKGTKK